MSTFTAGSLDGRNVGSVIGVVLETGMRIYATLGALHKDDPENPGEVGLGLSDEEDFLWVGERDLVEIYLGPEAKFLNHINTEMQRLTALASERIAQKSDTLSYMGGR